MLLLNNKSILNDLFLLPANVVNELDFSFAFILLMVNSLLLVTYKLLVSVLSIVTFKTTVWNALVVTLKFFILVALLIFIRGGIPRYRYDYLTKIGWIKFLSLVLSIFLTSILLVYII